MSFALLRWSTTDDDNRPYEVHLMHAVPSGCGGAAELPAQLAATVDEPPDHFEVLAVRSTLDELRAYREAQIEAGQLERRPFLGRSMQASYTRSGPMPLYRCNKCQHPLRRLDACSFDDRCKQEGCTGKFEAVRLREDFATCRAMKDLDLLQNGFPLDRSGPLVATYQGLLEAVIYFSREIMERDPNEPVRCSACGAKSHVGFKECMT